MAHASVWAFEVTGDVISAGELGGHMSAKKITDDGGLLLAAKLQVMACSAWRTCGRGRAWRIFDIDADGRAAAHRTPKKSHDPARAREQVSRRLRHTARISPSSRAHASSLRSWRRLMLEYRSRDRLSDGGRLS